MDTVGDVQKLNELFQVVMSSPSLGLCKQKFTDHLLGRMEKKFLAWMGKLD